MGWKGWLNLGGEQWIENDPSYVKFNKKSTVDSSIVGKRVVSKVNNLRFYESPSWHDKDVAGSVDVGLGFTIIDKVIVNRSRQYKVKNSCGSVFYITDSSYFVQVK
ncbi:N-acetylmuramoyl-L-alanine amidase [Bacillus mycoides]|nr:N-acetylmuramoyl-L-alanine amidase [Bacillus mycoides]MBG9595806.1 N-acetylmuramoyl-L-alanine amidase [Bacillus mycoides]SFQ54808.1 N-acetylmuramoyl-L-alanine amidase [Bacillus mycoides]